jgi:thiamine biosynthesis lipoprotein
MASGLEKSISIMEQHPELEALLIYNDREGNYKVHTTKGMDAIVLRSNHAARR